MAKMPRPYWLVAGFALVLACVSVLPASAQYYYRGGGGGFFGSLFGSPRGGDYYYQPRQRDYYGEPRQRDHGEQQQADSSRAPSPKKSDTTPTMTVMVMGDSMADWLAYGLEEAFSETPEIGILRRHKTYSGLIQYERRTDLDWWHVARDLLTKDKADFVVMMLGTNDRQAIRESAADRKKKEAEKKEPEKKEAEKKEQAQGEQQVAKPEPKADDDEAIAATEPPRGSGSSEFRSERWEQIYAKRIDETIATLKSKGIPVIWVGLPPIRGTRSTADAQYLNQLFRARAEAAGIVYVDVWDGFVDEGGKFTYSGPDFEGQTRRLRTGDGVHFTKQGARKLAHFVERELRRFMQNRSMPMAMPSPGGPQLQSAPGEPAARPVAGPVVPLTGTPTGGDELLGGRGTSPIHADATATRVLVKGEPAPAAPGRADDFRWPRGEASAAVEPLSAPAAAARDTPLPKPEPKQSGTREAARPEPGKPAEQPVARREQQRETMKPAETRPKPQQQPRQTDATAQAQPRPPAPIRPQPYQQQQYQQRPSGGFFGLFR
jgi:hypothetical protein